MMKKNKYLFYNGNKHKLVLYYEIHLQTEIVEIEVRFNKLLGMVPEIKLSSRNGRKKWQQQKLEKRKYTAIIYSFCSIYIVRHLTYAT